MVADPRAVAAGVQAEPVAEPKEAVLGILSGLVAPMVADVEGLVVMAGSIGSGVEAAWVPELDPKLAVVAVGVAAHESVSRLAEPVTEIVVAHKTGPRVAEPVYLLAPGALESRMAGLEGPKYLWQVEAVLGSDYVLPKVAVVGTDLEVVVVAVLGLDAKKMKILVAVAVFHPRKSQGQTQAALYN